MGPPFSAFRHAFLLAILAGGMLAQESWDRPVTVSGKVVQGCWFRPVPEEQVMLRTFVGPLITRERRLAAFDPPAAATRTDESGAFWLSLPRWTMAIDHPLAVVCRGTGYLVLPFDRETFETHLRVEADEREVRFVDAGGRPVAGACVATLIGVHNSSNQRAPTWGPRYENLVVAAIVTTRHDGRAWLPRQAEMALVGRGDDAIPVALRVDSMTESDPDTIVVPETFEAACVDERVRKGVEDKKRGPPAAAAIERATLHRWDGTGSVEGVVALWNDPAEVVVVPADASLDILASHRIESVRPRGPFTQTDRKGRFKLDNLPLGTWRLQVAAPHFAPLLTPVITIGAGRTAKLEKIQLERGGLLIVKGSMGYALLKTDLGTASVRFNSPNGLIDGLGPGRIWIGDWNGGCLVPPKREVIVPQDGEVVVDLSR